MKHTEFLQDAIGLVGEDLIREAREGGGARPIFLRRPRGLLVAAVCMLLAVASVMGALVWGDDGVIPIGPLPGMDGAESGEQVLYPYEPDFREIDFIPRPYLGSGMTSFSDASGIGASLLDPVIPANKDLNGITVTVELDEILPDVYQEMYDGRFYSLGRYRLLRFRTIRTLSGGEMCEWFYLAVSEFASYREIFLEKQYRYMILQCITQLTYERPVVYNETTGKTVALDLPLFTPNHYEPYYYNNMVENWFPAREIAMKTKWGENKTSVRLLYISTDLSDAVRAELAQIEPFRNGVYVEDWFVNQWTRQHLGDFTLMLAGYPTTETIRYTADSIAYLHSTPFTQEMIASLPDLDEAMETVIADFEAGRISPPHIADMTGLTVVSDSIFGWYTKSDSEVYGVVRVAWKLKSEERIEVGGWQRREFYDDLYLLVTAEGITPIEASELIALTGGVKLHVYTGEYDEWGKNALRYFVCL